MTKVKFLNAVSSGDLEEKVNDFVWDKDVLSVSFSTARLERGIWFYCSVLYREG